MRTEFAASESFHSPTDRSRSQHDQALRSIADGSGEDLADLVPSSKEPAVVVQLSEAASELAHHRSPFHNQDSKTQVGAAGSNDAAGSSSPNAQTLKKIEMILGAERNAPGANTTAAQEMGQNEKLIVVNQLSEQEEQLVMKLEARDREVRDHEMAHKAAAGPYAIGGPDYELTKGPDGKSYAIGGQVNIDTAVVPNDPQGTMHKMEIVRRAALAPVQPSSQDRQVASDASAKLMAARREILEARTEEKGTNELGGVEHRSGHWREIWRSSVENIQQSRKHEAVEVEVDRVGELQLLDLPAGLLEQDVQVNRAKDSGYGPGNVDGLGNVDAANSRSPFFAQPGLHPESAAL